MKNLMKRGLAVGLALMMCMGMLGTTAFAASGSCPACHDGDRVYVNEPILGGHTYYCSKDCGRYGSVGFERHSEPCSLCGAGQTTTPVEPSKPEETTKPEETKKPEEHKHVLGDSKPYGCSDEWCYFQSCSVEGCDHEVKFPHSWDSGVVTKQPTTTQEGEKTFTCTVCKAIKTEPIAKLTENENCDHKNAYWQNLGDHHAFFCPDCETVLNKDNIGKDHVFTPAEITVPATCEEGGKQIYRCVCGAVEERDTPVDPANHISTIETAVLDEATFVEAVNCQTKGHAEYHCVGCDAVLNTVEDAGPCVPGPWKELDALKHIQYCALCEKEIKTGSHNFGDWEPTTEWTPDPEDATYETRDFKRICEDCQYEETKTERQKRGNGILTITYEGAGEATPGVYSEEVEVGGSYSVATPEIPGYTVDIAVVSGTMDSKDGVQVTVTYTPIVYTLTVRHVTSTGNELATETIEVAYGASYSASARTFAGYNAGTTTDATSGTMTGNLTVTFTYARTVVPPTETTAPSEQPSVSPSPVVPPVNPVEDINEPNVPLGEDPADLVDIPEDDVPLTELPEDMTEIEDNDVPLSELPEDLTVIDDDEVPLASVPQTGDISMIWYGVSALSACGLTAVCASKKREDEEE